MLLSIKKSYIIRITGFILGAFTFSCVPNKKVIYMQNLPSDTPVAVSGELVPYDFENYLLQYNDVVDITIKTTSSEFNEIFDVNATENQIRMTGGIMNGGDIFFINGYTIDGEGLVDLPLIGEMHLVGMTTTEAKLAIKEKINIYFNEEDNYLFVRVRLGGIRYSALGEFNKPGKFTILQNRVTIYEAIANAGEMTTLAKRNEVKLVRQYPEGSRTHTINLNNDKLMASEFYFLRPNDLIYAEPMKVRELGTGTTFVQTFQLAVTTLTVVLLVINAIN